MSYTNENATLVCPKCNCCVRQGRQQQQSTTFPALPTNATDNGGGGMNPMQPRPPVPAQPAKAEYEQQAAALKKREMEIMAQLAKSEEDKARLQNKVHTTQSHNPHHPPHPLTHNYGH